METSDMLIIGGGCAGLSAGMYSARLGLKTTLFAELPGGLITTTHVVENWPGIISISGPDLGMNLWEHAKVSGVNIKSEVIQSVEKQGDMFVAKSRRNEYSAKTVVFATGSKHKHLGAPGEEEFANRGVSYCALCDGAFYKEKIVSIVGGGDSAAKEALFLAQHASKVYLIVRKDVLRAEPANLKLIEKEPKIEILFKEEVAEIMGSQNVEKIRLKSGKELEMHGVFVAIGQIPLTDLAASLGVALNPKGEIMINRHSETNVGGVYACGDCTDTAFKQAITGSAEGVTAAYFGFSFVKGGGGF